MRGQALSYRTKHRSWAAAAPIAVLLLLCRPATAEPPTLTGPGPRQLEPGTLTVASPPTSPGAVIMRWDGTIAAPMAGDIDKVFQAFKDSRRRFVLVLNSGGGSVAEGERVISLLQRLRRTHQLDTAVERGGRCGSMCVPIYLQGGTRFGARSSAWLFHEITRPSSNFGRQTKVEGSYMRLIEKYWVPAGVSRPWIDRMLAQAAGHDYWQTGDALINDNSGIITRPIENRTRRNLDPDTMMPSQAKGTPGSKPAPPGTLRSTQPPPVAGPASSPTLLPDAGGLGKRGAPTAAGPPPALK